MNIQDKKKELKLKSTDNLEGVLMELKSQLNYTSNLFNEFVLLYGRYKDMKDAYTKDTVPRGDRNIELAKIRGSLLELIDRLTDNDFDVLDEKNGDNIESHITEIEEDLGFYDYLEIAENGFKESTNSMIKIGGYTSELGNSMEEQTKKINQLNKLGSASESKSIAIKRVFREAATHFDDYNSKIQLEIPLFKDASGRSLNAFYKIVEFSSENNLQNEKELRDIYVSVVSLEDSSSKAINSMHSLTTAIRNLPKMEKELIKAKRVTTTYLENFCEELEEYRGKIRELRDYLDMNLSKIKKIS